MKHHYVYRIDHLDSDRFYIGVRTSPVEPEKDRYMGSGKIIGNLYLKYGKDRFEKTILATFGSRESALEFEKVEVDKYLGDPECLNLCRGGKDGGFCGWTSEQYAERTKKVWADPNLRKKLSKIRKKEWQDPKHRKKVMDARRAATMTIKQIVYELERSISGLKRVRTVYPKHTKMYKRQLAKVRHYAKKALELTDLTSEQKRRLDAAFIALAELGYTKGNPVIERALRYAA